MPEIHALEPVDLRKAWPNEAHNFTPWLANHLHLLGQELNLDLKDPMTEVTLPVAGRVDIIATQVDTGDKVVIENQLNGSDDSHCLRLMAYAANADANILVWVAQRFTPYHVSILNWLNESDNKDVYGVEVRAYQVGDALATDFRVVVEPARSQPVALTTTRMTMSTYYADFYRPLSAQLQRSGLSPVGRGGWRGRWRSFQTPHPQAIYVAELNADKASAYLYLHGPGHRHLHDALAEHRAEIDSSLGGGAVWDQGDQSSWVTLEAEAKIEDPAIDLEAVRQRMFDNLVRLRDATQSYLEEMRAAPDAGGDDAETDG